MQCLFGRIYFASVTSMWSQVCFNAIRFKRDRVSFCTECLKALQYTTLIRCPWCRVITKFPNANKPSVEDLPLNYSVIKVQDTIHSNNRHVLQCNVHTQEGVKYHCQTCDEYLCSECIVSETSKGRVVTSIEI